MPAWNFAAKIYDSSPDSVYLQFLGEQGTPVMGMDASSFHNLVEKEAAQNPQVIEEVVKGTYFKDWQMVVRAKMDTY